MKKSINLTPSLQKEWTHNTIKNLLKLFCFLILILTLLFLLHIYNKNQKDNIKEIQNKITEQHSQLKNIEQHLESLTPLPINYTKVLKPEEIKILVSLLQELPVKSAGISVIRFYVDQGLKLKIAGTYQNPQDFEELENFLKNNGFSINIEYLQSSDKAKAEFSIIVYKESN